MAYRILVVDDSPMFRIVLKEMFELLEQNVVGEADCGEAALEQFQKLKPEVVTLDISLPDIDGLTVFQQMKRLNPKIKVMLVTGNDQDKVIEQAEELGALGLITKPIKKEQLQEMLKKIDALKPPAAG